MIGENIKKLRIKQGLTQKDLAEKLFVTAQAVSRWENGEVEPSISTLTSMAKIFNTSVDNIVTGQVENEESNLNCQPEVTEEKETEKTEENVKIVEKVIQSKPVLAVCERCNKPIFDGDDIVRRNIRTGYGHHASTRQEITCRACDAIRIQNENEARERQHEEEVKKARKRRIISYVVGVILLALAAIIGFTDFEEDVQTSIIILVVGVGFSAFVSCAILNNTFVPYMWLHMSSWGIKKFPGIIFSFSIDGVIFLILMKILFFIIGALVSILAFLFATFVGCAVSLFVYPFAIVKSIRYPEEDY